MRQPLSLVPAALLALLLASCVGAPSQQSAPPPERAPAPVASAPAPISATVDWQYRPTTPGNWTYRAETGGAVAIFTSPSAVPLATIRCDKVARQISVTRSGGGQGAMTIRTSYGAASWPASASAAGLVAARAAADTTLDQIAYSRGRFALEAAGSGMVILPAWGEVSRVVEDCRS